MTHPTLPRSPVVWILFLTLLFVRLLLEGQVGLLTSVMLLIALLYLSYAHRSRREAIRFLCAEFTLVLAVIVLLRTVHRLFVHLPFNAVTGWWFAHVSNGWDGIWFLAIVFATFGVGLILIEVVGRISTAEKQLHFQWSLLAVAAVMATLNLREFYRGPLCYDCFFPYGFPLTLFRDGSFGGGGGIVWAGLLADLAIMFGVASIVAVLWNFVARSGKQSVAV